VKKSLLGFGKPKVRKTPSMSSLPRNDTVSERGAVPPCRFTFSVFAAHRSVGVSGCLSGVKILTIHLLTAALYKQTGRCEVTTSFIAIALFCCQKFNHSRSLTFAFKRSSSLDSTSSLEELRKKGY
jgi:hypothetical protein